jgi:hypothetical protein
LIAPERSLVHGVSGNVCLRRVQTCHNLVRSLNVFAPRMRPHYPSERLYRDCQNRFDGLPGHVHIAQHRPLNSKIKSNSHRLDRVPRKR